MGSSKVGRRIGARPSPPGYPNEYIEETLRGPPAGKPIGQDLENLFTPYGNETSARVLTTRHTDHPRGFGYVEMLKQHAECAISELNGHRINSILWRVSEARG